MMISRILVIMRWVNLSLVLLRWLLDRHRRSSMIVNWVLMTMRWRLLMRRHRRWHRLSRRLRRASLTISWVLVTIRRRIDLRDLMLRRLLGHGLCH